MNYILRQPNKAASAKFVDPRVTLDGKPRATVSMTGLRTLWFNTGTLCNLTCKSCYIESSPTNDQLVYLSRHEVHSYLKEVEENGWPLQAIGLTGGEPFMNPDILGILEDCLARDVDVLVLTNAMRPMLKHSGGLLALGRRFGDALTIRVSIDHYTKVGHQSERGKGSWLAMIRGLTWLKTNGFNLQIAGRNFNAEPDADLRGGFAALFDKLDLHLDAFDPADLVLFPELDAKADVPEISTACWSILGVDPATVMCASARMVVKRKGASQPEVVACTLLPYDTEFSLGASLGESFAPVALNHPHCARFCVLGGASCSG